MKKRKIHEKTQNSWKNVKFKILQLQPWDLAQKIGLDLRIPDHTLTSLCDHWASSYEGFKWAIEFRSQCCILLLHNYRCVVIMGFQIISQRANQFVWFNTTITIITTTSWCTRGVGKTRFQQSGHDTLRDRRKGDPQHKCCGKNACNTLGCKKTRYKK